MVFCCIYHVSLYGGAIFAIRVSMRVSCENEILPMQHKNVSYITSVQL